MEKRTFEDVYDLAEEMFSDAVTGKNSYAVLFYEEAVGLIRALLDYDEVSVSYIDISEETYNGYNKEYYIILSNDLTLGIEKAWQDKTEYHEAGFLYFEADKLYIDGSANYAIVKQQGNTDCDCYEIEFDMLSRDDDPDFDEDEDDDDDLDLIYKSPNLLDEFCNLINLIINGMEDKTVDKDEDEVIEFIKRRFPADCHWKCENCYYFALILKDRFPGGKICYDVINGHFSYKYKNHYYDHTGMINPDGYLVIWDDFDDYDSIQKQRVIRDCIK